MPSVLNILPDWTGRIAVASSGMFRILNRRGVFVACDLFGGCISMQMVTMMVVVVVVGGEIRGGQIIRGPSRV